MSVSISHSLNSSYLSLETANAEAVAGFGQYSRPPASKVSASTPITQSDPAATVSFSEEAQARQSQNSDSNTTKSPEKSEARNESQNGSSEGLTDEEQRQVDQLKKRDAEVKAHEQAHIAAGGAYVSGGASYEYEKGPDNQNYAVGGEVSIDTSAENTPEATIRKMQVVKRAALAPRDPSSQDRSVAAQATQAEARAQSELRQKRSEEAEGKREQNGATEINPAANSQENDQTLPKTATNPNNSQQTDNQHVDLQPNHLNKTAQTAYQATNPISTQRPSLSAFA